MKEKEKEKEKEMIFNLEIENKEFNKIQEEMDNQNENTKQLINPKIITINKGKYNIIIFNLYRNEYITVKIFGKKKDAGTAKRKRN